MPRTIPTLFRKLTSAKLFWPLMALAVLLLFSLGSLLAAMGMVGLYLGKVFLQTKNRPLYVIRREI